MTTYTISSRPFYDSFSQSYRNIYVVDRKPDGKFASITRQVHAPKLSPFISNENNCCNHKCIYAIYDPDNLHQFLCIEKLGTLFSYLTTNGYSIDTTLTTMMNTSRVEFMKNFICFVKKID